MRGVQSEFEVIKQGVAHLQTFDSELKQVFTKVERVYFEDRLSTKQQTSY